MSKILRVVKHAAASFASLLVQLFQMVLLKLGYEFKGTFSVVFLGLHTKPECVYVGLCSSWALWCSFSIVFCLAYVSLPLLLLIITVVLPFSYFPSVLELPGFTCEICVTVQIHVVVLTRKQQKVMFKSRNFS